MNPPTLKQYYQDILRWVESGCLYDNLFDPTRGLCENLNKWVYTQTEHDPKLFCSILEELNHELATQFAEAKLNPWCPFEKGDTDKYENDSKHNLLYKNPARLDWIRKHAS